MTGRTHLGAGITGRALLGAGMTPLICVAHGSRDARSAAVVAELVDAVRALQAGLDARPAFLDLSEPRLPEVLAAVAADGHRSAVVVPLLLGRAYHARVDVPAAVRDGLARLPLLCVRTATVLGPDPRLPAAALRRLTAAGAPLADPALGVVLAAAGSTHQPANGAVAAVAASWAASGRWAGVLPAFAAAAEPTVPAAISELRRRGARRIAVASWFLAPGVLPDRVAAAARAADPGALLAEPLGADPGLARLVLDRYRAALPTAHHRPAAMATATATNLGPSRAADAGT